MQAVLHFMEDGNFLCGYIGGGMVYEADDENDVTCPECKAIIDARNLKTKASVRKKKFSIYDDEDDE